MIATLVDWSLLGEAILSSLVIGLGVLVVTAIAVAASLRAQDSRDSGDEAAFVGFGAVAVLAVAGLLGAIAGGVWVMAR